MRLHTNRGRRRSSFPPTINPPYTFSVPRKGVKPFNTLLAKDEKTAKSSHILSKNICKYFKDGSTYDFQGTLIKTETLSMSEPFCTETIRPGRPDAFSKTWSGATLTRLGSEQKKQWTVGKDFLKNYVISKSTKLHTRYRNVLLAV